MIRKFLLALALAILTASCAEAVAGGGALKSRIVNELRRGGGCKTYKLDVGTDWATSLFSRTSFGFCKNG